MAKTIPLSETGAAVHVLHPGRTRAKRSQKQLTMEEVNAFLASRNLVAVPKGNAAAERDLIKLQNAIYDIDTLSQGAFSSIDSIARLVLMALEHPDTYRCPTVLAGALQCIREKACEIEDCISSEAERLGCNYKGEDADKIFGALHTARQKMDQQDAAIRAAIRQHGDGHD